MQSFTLRKAPLYTKLCFTQSSAIRKAPFYAKLCFTGSSPAVRKALLYVKLHFTQSSALRKAPLYAKLCFTQSSAIRKTLLYAKQKMYLMCRLRMPLVIRNVTSQMSLSLWCRLTPSTTARRHSFSLACGSCKGTTCPTLGSGHCPGLAPCRTLMPKRYCLCQRLQKLFCSFHLLCQFPTDRDNYAAPPAVRFARVSAGGFPADTDLTNYSVSEKCHQHIFLSLVIHHPMTRLG